MTAMGSKAAVVAPAYEPKQAQADRRTVALLPSSVNMLKNIGVWEGCASRSAPLEGVRIVDDRNALLRAPEVLFRARDLDLPHLGVNVPNAALSTAFHAAIRKLDVMWFPTAAVVRAEPAAGHVTLELAEGGCLTAKLAVAADGRNSVARAAAEIATRTWTYNQAAIAATFAHSRSHGGITTELHRRAGPLTIVPLPGNTSSLVWVDQPEEIKRLQSLDDVSFSAELQAQLKGLLGTVNALGPRAAYPIAGLAARRMGQRRIALVGEAAHVIPPIGAQGLNLGLRDGAVLAECVATARGQGQDIGGRETLDAYHAARAADVLARAVSVDLLNRSLIVDFLPAQALRGLGLHLLANAAPLRRLAMRGGLSAAGPLPHLMRSHRP
jgi:2-octaprenyl-6-methoxyphenol hydroxylase